MTGAQSHAEVALRHIRHLTETIGPRGSTTPQERQAAEYARDVLRGLGIEARLESFQSGRSTSNDQNLAVAFLSLNNLRMPASAPDFTHGWILGTADRYEPCIPDYTYVAADAFADIVEPPLANLHRQERIGNRRACRTDQVDQTTSNS